MPKQSIGYLGPKGTYTEAAALQYNYQAKLVPYPSISLVASAVDSKDVDIGIVPIENSLQGPVTETLDLLIHDSHLSIVNEIVLPIHHSLMVKPGSYIEDIQLIYSHTQALAQCRHFIEQNMGGVQAVASLSTAAAVEDMLASEVPAAAIATERAAILYGAEIIFSGIQDNMANHTRFVVLATHDHDITGDDKTSICFSFDEDRSGMLYHVLGQFAQRNINLAKVESRPNKESLGRYIFLMDLIGHKKDPIVSEALSAIAKDVSMLKVFGSYPRFHGA